MNHYRPTPNDVVREKASGRPGVVREYSDAIMQQTMTQKGVYPVEYVGGECALMLADEIERDLSPEATEMVVAHLQDPARRPYWRKS